MMRLMGRFTLQCWAMKIDDWLSNTFWTEYNMTGDVTWLKLYITASCF